MHSPRAAKPGIPWIALLLLLSGATQLYPQEVRDSSRVLEQRERIPSDGMRDTSGRGEVRPSTGPITAGATDSMAADTVRASGSDTTATFAIARSTDTTVVYSARDSVVYSLSAKKMRLYGAADIAYGRTGIRAERITVDWDASTILATGIPDSTNPGGPPVGTPVFKEGSDEYSGRTMTYNFRSKQGVITEGETKLDEGFYLGERIKRKSDDVYFIGSGRYTTCDNPDHKHYYFGSPRMKVIPNDVIVAEPIVLYIEDIPLFGLPFAVIPSKSGRSSGIIIPAFGDDYARGRYLRGGGYYFAASDYWDARLTGDWFSKGGYQLFANVRYALRYSFDGSVSASFGRQRFAVGNPFVPDDQPRTDYKLEIAHRQTLDPLSQISVDFRFMTDSYYNSFSNDFNQLLNQSSYSSAMYSTSWEGTGRSFGITITRDQNLRNGTSTSTLPSITFNQGPVFPFRREGSTGDGPWYELLGFDYRASGLHRLDVTKGVDMRAGIDTSEVTRMFSRRGVQHNVNLLFAPKLGYVTIQPNFTYGERWYDHRVERQFDPSDSTVRGRDVSGFFALRTFSLGVSANTKLYGTITPNIAGILGIRHTIQPSVSYSYNPDFSKDAWGYYQSYRGLRDSLIRYDPYTGHMERPGEVYGGVGSGESQRLGLRVSNIFEMKIRPREEDTTNTPRKFQLFNLDASTSYNFAADSMRLAPLSLGYRTSIENLLSISGSVSMTPYRFRRAQYGTDTLGNRVLLQRGGEYDRYVWQDGLGLARLTSFDIHLESSLSSDMFTPAADTAAAARAGGYAHRMRWNLSLGYDYAMNQSDPDNKSRSSSMRASLSFDPTPNWKISGSVYYDFVTRQVGAPQISITRDLHCWEMLFNWVPSGFNRNFSLVIRLKAPQLQDIKLEKKGSDRGVYY